MAPQLGYLSLMCGSSPLGLLVLATLCTQHASATPIEVEVLSSKSDASASPGLTDESASPELSDAVEAYSSPRNESVIAALAKDACQGNRASRGKGYMGTVSKTRSGRDCQRWDAQYPHKHNKTNPWNFPDPSWEDQSIRDVHNYCRNPNNAPGGVWCFTTDVDKISEYCDVPYCDQGCVPEYGVAYEAPGFEYQIKWGYKLIEELEGTWTECARICRADRGCTRWLLDHKAKSCWLQNHEYTTKNYTWWGITGTHECYFGVD